MGLSFWHILIVLLVVVMLFGAGKIPRLMKDLGSGVTAFKRGLKEGTDDTAQASSAPGSAPQIQSHPSSAGEKKAEEAVRRT
jgi:sec-independent protein translocase protein TatA